MRAPTYIACSGNWTAALTWRVETPGGGGVAALSKCPMKGQPRHAKAAWLTGGVLLTVSI